MRVAILLVFLILSQSVSAQFVMQELKCGKPGIYRAETTYPHFRETSPLTRFANSKIVEWVKRDQADHILTAEEAAEIRKRDQEQAKKYGGWSNLPWEYNAGCQVTMFRPNNLISILCKVFEYTGGAHPNTTYQAFNFGHLAGHDRTLTLSDFFRQGGRPPEGIRKIIAKKAKNPEGNSVGKIEINDTEVDKFVVEPDGLRFVFNQCEIAACYAGELEAKVTIKDLGSDFRRDILNR